MNTDVSQQSAAAGKRFLRVVTILIISILIAAFLPWNAWALTSNSHPLQSYEEATRQIEVLRADRQAEMNPDCLLQFLTHGHDLDPAENGEEEGL